MEDPSQNLVLQFVLLLILTLLNAFFSASEMALVSLNRSRVEQKAEEGDKKFIRLLSVLENPNNFLSTIQVGITFISLLQGASLSASLGGVIASWFGDFVWAQTAGSVISSRVIFSSASSNCIGVIRERRLVDADKSQTKGLTIFPRKMITGAEITARFSLRFMAIRFG